MGDTLQIDVESAGLLAALASVPAVVTPKVKAAAKVTALAIQAEARARVARRTGRTAAGITVEESHDGTGYVVSPFNEAHRRQLGSSGNIQQARNLPTWLEFGTQTMTARPYFFSSARLEEGPHHRRIHEALVSALDESGLGD